MALDSPRNGDAYLIEVDTECAVCVPAQLAWPDGQCICVPPEVCRGALGHGPAIAICTVKSDIYCDMIFGIASSW